MERKIRVSSELRASDVPPGTTVTPRGREYMLLGLLGGWVLGGVCMYLTWDTTNPAVSALKVFGAATGGSLLGTFASWFMPGTRKRMKVIKELKVHLEEERKAEAEAREYRGRTITDVPSPHRSDRRSMYETQEMPAPRVRQFQSRQVDDEPTPAVYSSPEEPRPRPRRPKIERIDSPKADGDTGALLDALQQYKSIDPDEPR